QIIRANTTQGCAIIFKFRLVWHFGAQIVAKKIKKPKKYCGAHLHKVIADVRFGFVTISYPRHQLRIVT
ncbi:MAG: hypothetical protein WBQ60_12055, partial [Asticcacaulis sp.]